MKKIFISQPMRGKTDEEILKERDAAVFYVQELFNDREIEVIDSFFKDAPHDAKPLWYIGKSIQLMADADIVFFAEGWKDARGCKIEHECAVQYGKVFIDMTEDEFLND